MINYVFIAIPFFFLAMLIEYLIGKRQQKELYGSNDTISNLGVGIGNRAISVFSTIFLVWVYTSLQSNFGLFSAYLQPSILNFFICLILFDCLYYWAHRWSHEWNFLWGAHVVHHQSEEYNLSVALRQSWFHGLLAFFIFLPIPILGFDPQLFFGVAALITLYQFWIHTKAIKRMPRWFEFIFNSPSHHRVHHAVNPKYIDKNHAAVFIIWDRLFGTFKEEEEEPTYGITTQLKSFNPTWANFHYYVEMYQIAKKAKSWKDKFKVLFARPGWRPEDQGGYMAPPPVSEDRKKYETHTDDYMRLYAVIQFFVVLFGLIAFMNNFDRISEFYRWAFLAIIILSIMICTGILENKRWVIMAEYVRLGIVLLSLNTFYYFWFADWFLVMIISSLSLGILSSGYFTWSWRKHYAQMA